MDTEKGEEDKIKSRETHKNEIYCKTQKISRFLEGIPIDHIYNIDSLESQLQIRSICSIRIRSRNRDIGQNVTA